MLGCTELTTVLAAQLVMPVSLLLGKILSALLQAALLPPYSVERLLYVSAFVASTYNTLKRTDAPFESLQNATYELVYAEKGIRMIMERVCACSLFKLHCCICWHNATWMRQGLACPAVLSLWNDEHRQPCLQQKLPTAAGRVTKTGVQGTSRANMTTNPIPPM